MARVKYEILFAAAAAAMLASSAVAQQATTIAQDASAFGKREGAWAADISPGGNRAVLLVAGPAGVTIVKVVDLQSGTAKNILGAKDSKESIDWCQFGSDEILICRYSGNSYEDGQLIPFSRLIAIRHDGSKMTPLGQKASTKDASLRQFDGRIIDWMPNDPDAVLMARRYIPEVGTTGTNIVRTRSGLGIDKVDLDSMRASSLEAAKEEASEYISDGQGNVRIMVIEDDYADNLTGRIRYKYRKTGSSSWLELGQSTGPGGISVLAVDGTTNSAYVLKDKGGRDALYRISLDGNLTQTPVAENPEVDIDGVVRVGKGQKVIGYTFTDTQRRIVYFDTEYASLANSLGKALRTRPLIYVEGASADGNSLLVFAGADTHPGAYYVLDRTSKKMQELAPVRANLDGRVLASVKPITYKAADGSSIPAYLTMPAGASGKNMPLVVLPHGGPASRDEWGFDWLAQFLAARGYAVIQPNYRGSSGYGAEFMNKNAFQNWRTAISDIDDAARAMIKEGIADPNRVAILGWSYGGYAALQAAVVDPTLYKQSIAIAPVTDFALVKKEAKNFTNSKLVDAMVGTGPHVVQGSPLQNAERIQVPVLMFHGSYDVNVDIEQSEAMEKALRKAGKKVEFVRYEGLDHQLEDSNARADMLNRIGMALKGTIG